MTAAEKQEFYRLLNLAWDFLSGGYSHERDVPDFADDQTAGMEAAAGPAASAPAETERSGGLQDIAAGIAACRACGLCEQRSNTVPGEGPDRPLVLAIGEGPGADEDRTGRPFVGKAGQLLDKMLAAIDLSRDTNCFITNIVKCRPPENRDPRPEESAACLPFLRRQIAALKPRLILAVGRISAQTLLQTQDGIGKLRGRFFDYNGILLMPTYHPSALLRDPSLKRPAWEDLKVFREKLGAV